MWEFCRGVEVGVREVGPPREKPRGAGHGHVIQWLSTLRPRTTGSLGGACMMNDLDCCQRNLRPQVAHSSHPRILWKEHSNTNAVIGQRYLDEGREWQEVSEYFRAGNKNSYPAEALI